MEAGQLGNQFYIPRLGELPDSNPGTTWCLFDWERILTTVLDATYHMRSVEHVYIRHFLSTPLHLHRQISN
jgi:hypothetical protein